MSDQGSLGVSASAADEGGQSGTAPEQYEQVPTYGPPAGYEHVPAYGPPAGYEQVPAYGPPAGYEQAQAYWPPAGYEQVPGYPGSASPPVGGGPGGASETRGGRGIVGGVVAGTVAGLIFGLLSGIGGYAVASRVGGGPRLGIPQYAPANPEQLSPRADNSIAAIAKEVLPTTATIIFKGQGQAGSGSGFVMSEDGYLITNSHVVQAAANGGSVAVQFHNEDPIPAKIVGRSVPYDIAVVKVERAGLAVAKMGDSTSVAVGDAAIAVGSPLGLDGTVTSGIISAVNRPVTTGGQGEASYISAMQTDAPINPGNSGGPLVNSEGLVVGVNSAIATLGDALGGQSGSIGLGFAIPINTAKRIAQEIVATGKSSYPILGVNVDTTYEGEGTKIKSVAPGTPAAGAGLKQGEVITAVNGSRTYGWADLLSAIRSYAPGDTIKLTVQTGSGQKRDVEVTLGSQTE